MSRLTPSQQRAVAARGNVLLEAGAGAGKTSTLVARCLAQVLAPANAISLDEILMVTFTEAAATEMRHRIRGELNQRHAADPADTRLAEQLALLDQAQIGTLHGFCLGLIRENFGELALDPQLRVLDETEARLVAQETLRDLLDAAYERTDEAGARIRDLIRRHADGNDATIGELTLMVHWFIQTLPCPSEWLARERARWQQPDPAAWESMLLGAANEQKPAWRELLTTQPVENLVASRCRQLLEGLGDSATRKEWTVVLRGLASYADDQHWKHGEKGKFRAPLQPLFTEAEFLASLTRTDDDASDPLLDDAALARPHMLAVLDLVTEFSADYAGRKKQLSGLDFSDLEQFCLRLLLDEEGQPTAVALQWRQRFRQVFVDEYQDINEAQDRIIAALSGEGDRANRFLVGDVKQSIYGFRLARPDIFLRYARIWRTDPAQGQVLPLADNFRSHEAILGFVNHCFRALLREDVGGVGYSDEACLQFGDPDERKSLSRQQDPSPRVELIHRQTAKRTPSAEPPAVDEEDQSNAETEALLAASRLAELRATGFQVYDRKLGALRPVTWRDMAILLRATSGKAEVYTRVFARAGVPLVASRRGFFEALEISDLVSLLVLLDNPLQDIPLLAVLRAPIVGLTPDELATIRTTTPHEHAYWTAAMRFHELHANATTGSSEQLIALRLGEFLGRFQQWRDQARHGSLAQTLEDILETTRYLSWLATQSRGAEAQQNVQRLLDLTREYDSWRGHGLHRFLHYVRLVQEQGDGPEPASAPPADAVRLMTIHGSKGLEFPVVVLADLGKRFRGDSPNGGIRVDEQLGLCPTIMAPDGSRSYPSLPLHLAGRAGRERGLAEELRLLYVAMTRACDRLILLGTTPASRPEKYWPAPVGPQLSRSQLLAANSLFDFIGPLLPGLCGNTEWFATASGAGDLLSWRVVGPVDEIVAAPITPLAAATAATDEGVSTTALRRHIEFHYPFLEATHRAGKTTVTRLRKQLDASADEETAGLFADVGTARPGSRGQSRGKPGTGLSATATGIAYHTFFQRMQLDAPESLAGLEAERQRLLETGALNDAEAAAIQLEKVRSFWTGPVGMAFLEHRAAIRRELPFTAAFSVAELDAFAGRTPVRGNDESDLIIVQGIADLALIRENEIWILDFKSDRVPIDQLTARVAAYRPQVQLYQQALERTCRRPVSRLWLHFLHLDRTIEVNLS